MPLPVGSPTESYWQTPRHPLASYRSDFPSAADVVIIGSGITGSSVARTLFEQSPSLKIVILEARLLCSGATGRNGGHIKPGTRQPLTVIDPSFLPPLATSRREIRYPRSNNHVPLRKYASHCLSRISQEI